MAILDPIEKYLALVRVAKVTHFIAAIDMATLIGPFEVLDGFAKAKKKNVFSVLSSWSFSICNSLMKSC